MNWGNLLEWAIKAIVLCLGLTGGFAYLTLFERKVLARMQVRMGPNRAGPYGLVQPITDGIKLIFKEELTPTNADKFVFFIAPILTVLPALIITAVVPWGPAITLFGRKIELMMTDINLGILYLLAVTAISVYGITLAGWASNNKYAVLGGLRSAAQMISYELAMGFAMMAPVMMAGSMSLVAIVEAQKSMWFAVLQPVAFIIYYVTSVAEINRAPFDMPEAEQELATSFTVEYSGMKFALFYMAEYIKMIAISLIGSSLFLGGFNGPFIDRFPGLGPLYLVIKVVIWLFTLIWIRATLPRIRYDKLMQLGWKVLFPVALLNVLVTAVVLILTGN